VPTQSLPVEPAAPLSSDAELVPRLRAGEPAALAEVYRRHAGALLGTAVRLLGAEAEAQDLVQDLFVGLPEALARYEERGQFAPWLRRILVRMALMQLRRGRRRRESGLESAGATVDRRHAAGTDGIALRRALDQLPQGDRTLIVLRAIEGYRHEEIAELLGVRRNTVEVRYHRALHRLRELLEER
jgi:RNA polymerase sigma-70 factor (ECF subfamily)